MATPLGGTRKRRRTEIAPIGEKLQRKVCFSKRKKTLLKKARDLRSAGEPSCPLRVAIVAFTIGGKPIAVGLPSLDPILDDYLTQFGDGDHKRRRTDPRAATEAEMDERVRVMASKWDEELQAEQLTQTLRSLETTASPIFDGDSAPVISEEASAVGDAVTPAPCSCEDDDAAWDFVDSLLVDDTDDDSCSDFDLCSQVDYSVWKDILINGDHGDLLM